ncbi:MULTISPECIES: ABC transporter ATP-binding protein [unclassified Clostridioides]|uniref:ABC transporter ATP-binding protein n=1 Tax=unclassified Clostridioides TaxID=2635829 RepID=UPI001D12C4EE|nr:ABC transporter ATP-binding protein [Clostridioides sp. ZZV15-6388]MCC0644297.1 ABC transporter ATP-binding protein [Clostridioides sp. ZZV14-6150]MCC0659378.1 ABC transporter ATP-binding protein [Clostridioides sp. ZZV14-6154]MCC0665628.1 ABC transporter ATP-binding protein [Clostridioides sp. ZZV15-6597]MCC0667107.1 ABC transporter ATP-binding protein [Clostridioides sp. ZZV14-6153]MCC0718615.1 ABC transporter ATP-binding protein [Clostridioides sp. ZZV14-6105]MCC0740462.1 ABC transporte
MLAIEINNLVKEYKNGVKALNGLSFSVKAGEIFSLLGPNGAGKSSLINILTTFYKPTAGNVTMFGKDLINNPSWIRTQIACVAQQISIDEHLSLMENMLFQSKMYKVEPQVAKERINSLIEKFELTSYLKYPTSSYSGGVKRRLDIAMNMVSSPKILFLDEPTVGMDVDSRKAMWDMLLKIRDEYGTTIFLTTHYLEEAEQLSDNICIMKNGKDLAQGTPSSLRSYIKQNILRIVFHDNEDIKKYKNDIKNTCLVKFMNVRGNSLFISVEDSRTALTSINKFLLEHNIKFDAIEIVEPSLEDVFLALTSSKKDSKEEWKC